MITILLGALGEALLDKKPTKISIALRNALGDFFL
jgi:hypothetical protein